MRNSLVAGAIALLLAVSAWGEGEGEVRPGEDDGEAADLLGGGAFDAGHAREEEVLPVWRPNRDSRPLVVAKIADEVRGRFLASRSYSRSGRSYSRSSSSRSYSRSYSRSSSRSSSSPSSSSRSYSRSYSTSYSSYSRSYSSYSRSSSYVFAAGMGAGYMMYSRSSRRYYRDDDDDDWGRYAQPPPPSPAPPNGLAPPNYPDYGSGDPSAGFFGDAVIVMENYNGHNCDGVPVEVIPTMTQNDIDHVINVNAEECLGIPSSEGYSADTIYERWACSSSSSLTQSFHVLSDCSDAAANMCQMDTQGRLSNVPCIWDVGGTGGSPLGTCIANQASNSSIMYSGAFTCGGGGSDAGATAGGVVGGLAFFCCLAAICFVGVAKRYPRRARSASSEFQQHG